MYFEHLSSELTEFLVLGNLPSTVSGSHFYNLCTQYVPDL